MSDAPRRPSLIRRLIWIPIAWVLMAGAAVIGCIGLCVGVPCFSTGARYGMWIEQCPAGDVRLGGEVTVSGVVRGGEGTLTVLPYGRYLVGDGGSAWQSSSTLFRGVSIDATLLDDEEQPIEGLVVGRWKRVSGHRMATLRLPDLPDGDYTLRVTLTGAGEVLPVDVALPLYAPAVTHVMTDRPLYKPGQEVLVRSASLRRTDLTPLDGRPGRWTVTSPSGDEMMVERARAGAYGVAATSFPLDTRAELGTWSVSWQSGEALDTVSFDVRPFQLPRLAVELTSAKRWYGIGDTLVVDGIARYSSGAPVADAPVEFGLRVAEGRWPLPLEWEAPTTTRTGPDGRFRVDLGPVPSDLVDRSVLTAWASVTEEAGEEATGSTRAILSVDDLRVEAVTELGDGLVGGFNNRAYLRVSTPDGVPLPGAAVVVTNPWDPLASPKESAADEDGVAALQLDPGDPVTVRIPPIPVRVRPLTPDAPQVRYGTELGSGASLDLAERRALDAIAADVGRCGDLAPGGREVSAGVRVDGGGAVRDVLTGATPAERCVQAALRGVRFPAGGERTYALTWYVPDSLVASFPVVTAAAAGSDGVVRTALEAAAVDARRCVRFGRGTSGSTVLTAHWRTRSGARGVDATWTEQRSGTGLDAAELACLRTSFQRAELSEPAKVEAMGTASVSMYVPSASSGGSSGPTTTTGYELKVSASVDGAPVGDTRLVLGVGTIPALRLRATPSLASPGDTVAVELLRGPDFYGELPEELVLRQGTADVVKAPVDPDTRTATFVLPTDGDGFYNVDWAGARVVVFARPAHPLSVSLATDKPSYRPGEAASLLVTTRAGDAPAPAGVGLVGVDAMLGQLAPLLGPDDYGRVTVRVEADQPAFGAFDPRALTLGQVRGENAAKAAVLRITQLPLDPAGDAYLYQSVTPLYDDDERLITSFYRVLGDLRVVVRAWEKDAPAGEVMTPDRMVAMWDGVLAHRRGAGEPATDAFGRALTLDVLPADLLAQVDPRQVVSDATRLPEDVVSWERYVSTEVPR